MNILAVGKIILTLLPIVADTIKAVEDTQGSGNGNYKKTLALGIINAIYSSTNPTVPFAEVVGHVEQIISALVEFYNSTKVFTKPIAAIPVAA